MREFPPWASRARFGDGLSEAADPQCRATVGELWTPSMANATTARLVHSYFGATVQHLVATYGTCVAGISPTLNNEFETRYTQSHACARDYSNASLAEYERWQLTLQTPRGGGGGVGNPLAAPVIDRFPICVPRTDVQWHRWLEFREQFLASQYELLCKRVQASGAHCFLHFGEFFASTDLLNSNLFFTLAKSPYVDELIMDSNMALLGAASSPSVVGRHEGTARRFTTRRRPSALSLATAKAGSLKAAPRFREPRSCCTARALRVRSSRGWTHSASPTSASLASSHR